MHFLPEIGKGVVRIAAQQTCAPSREDIAAATNRVALERWLLYAATRCDKGDHGCTTQISTWYTRRGPRSCDSNAAVPSKLNHRADKPQSAFLFEGLTTDSQRLTTEKLHRKSAMAKQGECHQLTQSRCNISIRGLQFFTSVRGNQESRVRPSQTPGGSQEPLATPLDQQPQVR